MKDIAINGDTIVLENGDIKLVDGRDRVIQQITVGLKILKGDWFLDYRAGIDYLNGMKAYPKLLKAEIKKAILDVIDVENIRNYEFKKSGDKYQVTATVIIDNQTYKIGEEYSI